MSMILPNLLYLTIYNPTLRPPVPVPDDDDDAEEQAHILFYTSRERAVSRDRMLRQVGLAKALVNFSDMFNGIDMCNNVHSQSKRLIMVSPEPDFWIHAAVEVAKMPRNHPDKGKAKARDKSKSNEKNQEKESEKALLYDYQEGSVHDLALRTDILRGYERFKLTHGSFTSILSSIGQEGLQLQLERFFTVWAWSWNLEDGTDFREHLGIPLHPSFRTLAPALDDYSQKLPTSVSSIFIQPPHFAPSPQYFTANHPSSLSQHLLSLIPPTPPPSEVPSQSGTIRGRRLSEGGAANVKDPTPKGPSTSTFLGMPAVTMNVKWAWPAALSFGKGPNKRTALEDAKPVLESKEAGSVEGGVASDAPVPSTIAAGLDNSALEVSISDDASITAPPSPTPKGGQVDFISLDNATPRSPPSEPAKSNEASNFVESQAHPHIQDPADADSTSTSFSSLSILAPAVSPQPSPVFSSTNVHLASQDNLYYTTRQKVYYIINNRTMLALVGLDEESAASMTELPQSALDLLDDIETLLSNELSKTLTPDQLSSVSKILQPTDTHIVSTGQYILSSDKFSSRSSFLYDAEELQTLDPDISEVFSRGLNPQHWHIARRGFGATGAEANGALNAEEVYMQIFRKEASLSDVDNILAGVVRRSGLVDGVV